MEVKEIRQGMKVKYFPIIGGTEYEEATVVSKPFYVCGSICVFLDIKSSCIDIENLEIIRESRIMTTEEIQLLSKDLCARLPYGVNVKTKNDNEVYRLLFILPYKDIATIGLFVGDESVTTKVHIKDIKPYLRPMSSMTDDEKKEIEEILEYSFHVTDKGSIVSNDWRDGAVFTSQYDAFKIIDFCNKHHLDYRGLIPMDLALEAKEGMYNIK